MQSRRPPDDDSSLPPLHHWIIAGVIAVLAGITVAFAHSMPDQASTQQQQQTAQTTTASPSPDPAQTGT